MNRRIKKKIAKRWGKRTYKKYFLYKARIQRLSRYSSYAVNRFLLLNSHFGMPTNQFISLDVFPKNNYRKHQDQIVPIETKQTLYDGTPDSYYGVSIATANIIKRRSHILKKISMNQEPLQYDEYISETDKAWINHMCGFVYYNVKDSELQFAINSHLEGVTFFPPAIYVPQLPAAIP